MKAGLHCPSAWLEVGWGTARMASSTTKNVVKTAGSWLFLGAFGFVIFMYPAEMKRVGYWMLGTSPQEIAARIEADRRAQTETPAQPKPARRAYGTVELKASSNGHYHSSVSVNGRDIDVMVDTGATRVALTYEDAERAGIYVQPADFTHRVNTANGTARVAPIRIEQISIGDITLRDVAGLVSEPGRMNTTLLGMSFLGRLKRAEMRSGTLILEQ